MLRAVEAAINADKEMLEIEVPDDISLSEAIDMVAKLFIVEVKAKCNTETPIAIYNEYKTCVGHIDTSIALVAKHFKNIEEATGKPWYKKLIAHNHYANIFKLLVLTGSLDKALKAIKDITCDVTKETMQVRLFPILFPAKHIRCTPSGYNGSFIYKGKHTFTPVRNNIAAAKTDLIREFAISITARQTLNKKIKSLLSNGWEEDEITLLKKLVDTKGANMREEIRYIELCSKYNNGTVKVTKDIDGAPNFKQGSIITLSMLTLDVPEMLRLKKQVLRLERANALEPMD